MKYLAIIPARGGSKRIKRKNIKMLGGKPLIAWSIESALASEKIGKVFVSTEDSEIAAVAKQYGAEIIKRPDDLARDETKTEPVMLHALSKVESDYGNCENIILLQATSPLRESKHIDEAIKQYERSGADSLVSVVEDFRFAWSDSRPLNYSLENYNGRPPLKEGAMEPLLIENGAIYITSRKVLLEKENRLGGEISVFKMPRETGLELDNPWEWQEAEMQMLHSAKIRPDQTYIIAEIGCNHMGDMSIARQMIEIAHFCGVNAVKGQKRYIQELLTEEEYHKPYDNPHSFGATYGEHREALEFSFEDHLELAQYAQKRGMLYFLSVWDETSARETVRLMNPAIIKIPSAKLTNPAILQIIKESGATAIASTGMSTLEEIDMAVERLQGGGPIHLLQCTSAYPVDYKDIHLNTMVALRQRYQSKIAGIGFSGHHLGIAVDVGAVAMGAKIIERHFTLDRTWKGTDHAASLEPGGLQKLVRDIRAFEKSLGSDVKKVLDCEMGPRIKLRGAR